MHFCIVGGFCDSQNTSSRLYGSNTWLQTGGNFTSISSCRFGAPRNLLNSGTEMANAIRFCMQGGQWSEPDYSACRDG